MVRTEIEVFCRYVITDVASCHLEDEPGDEGQQETLCGV